jgi:hypothetical protein
MVFQLKLKDRLASIKMLPISSMLLFYLKEDLSVFLQEVLHGQVKLIYLTVYQL